MAGKKKKTVLAGKKRARKAGFLFKTPTTELKAVDTVWQRVNLAGLQIGGSGGGTSGGTSNASAGVFTLLNGLCTGADFCNRIGRQVVNKSLEIVLAVTPIGTASVPPANMTYPFFDMGRIMLVYDRQANATSLSGTSGGPLLLQNVPLGGSASLTNNNVDFLNLDQRDRWLVIKDWRTLLPFYSFASNVYSTNFGGIDPVSPTFFKKMYISLGGLVTQYNNGSAGTIADIVTGAIYLYTGAFYATAPYSVWFTARIRYWDQ